MKLPLPRSRKAVLLVGAVVLAAGGGLGAVTVLGDGDPALAAAEAPAPDAAVAEPATPSWLVTVDPAALPEAPAPADAPVVEPEGDGGMLSLGQLAELRGATVLRDGTGRLRVTHGDWRATATVQDAVAGLPGVLAAHEQGQDAFLVETELAPEQVAGLPGVVTVANADGTPLDTAATAEATAAEEPAADAGH